jgi:hypothetical protein
MPLPGVAFAIGWWGDFALARAFILGSFIG